MELDKETLERYAWQAKAQWGQTAAYREFAEKSKDRSAQTEQAIGEGLMTVFADFGKCKAGAPASSEAQALVKRLQAYITEHYFTCTPELLRSLGQMYAEGDAFTQNIDAAGGAGTAQFVQQAIDACLT